MAGVWILIGAAVIIAIMRLAYKRKAIVGYDTFLIKKGKHYSIRPDSLLPWTYKFALAPKTLRFTAIFGNGCNYDDSQLANDRFDVSKLYGISYGFDDQWRSVRIGWEYDSNLKVIKLYLYAHVRGKRVIKPLTNVHVNDRIHFTLFIAKGGRAIVEIKDVEEDQIIATDFVDGIDATWLRFILWPYFGGNRTAPNDMKIFITEQ